MITIDGTEITSEHLNGKLTLINFWATDCPGCINEMPALIQTYKQYKNKGLEVIAVAMYYDPPSRVISYAKNNELPFPVVLDSNKEIMNKFKQGEINIICATSIAEEGLDIPEVNSVIFYEPIPSAIRSIQRRV